MTWRAVIPAWVSPPRTQVDDLHWLSYRVFCDQDSVWAQGIAATLSWVCGGRTATITGRDTQPVTQPVAQYEQWAATAVIDAGGPLPTPPLESFAAHLGVSYLPPRASNPDWARGTRQVLRWLTGTHDAQSPIPLPQRHPDGTVLTEPELREQLLAQPGYQLPEMRLRAEIEAAKQARRSRELADLVADTRRQLAGPTAATAGVEDVAAR